MSTEIASKITLSAMVDAREDALQKFAEASALMREARERIESVIGASKFYLDSNKLRNIDRSDFPAEMTKSLDTALWRFAVEYTSIAAAMNCAQKEEFMKNLTRGEKRTPDGRYVDCSLRFTAANVSAVALDVQSKQMGMFEDTVVDLHKRLSRRHKTNTNVFRKKAIFAGMRDRHGYSLHASQDTIIDLERVCRLILGEAPPETYGGLCEFVRKIPTDGETRVFWIFEVKAYQNGNVHVKLRDDNVHGRLTAILAKRYSNQLDNTTESAQ